MSTPAQQLAENLDGIDYRNCVEQGDENDTFARNNNLIIVFGMSDDLIELRGAVFDESEVYDGGIIKLHPGGILSSRDDLDTDEEIEQWVENKKRSQDVETLFCDEGKFTWTYNTDIPHETFIVKEDGEDYCRGLIIDIADLG